MEQVPHQQANEVARTRAGKRGIDPGGGAGPPGGHGVGGLARQWPRGLTPAAAACEGGGLGEALAAALRAKAARGRRRRSASGGARQGGCTRERWRRAGAAATGKGRRAGVGRLGLGL